MRRRKRFNPGEMPLIAGLAGDAHLVLKRLAAVVTAATLLFAVTGGYAALAREPAVAPPPLAAIADAPLLTMEAMISAGKEPFDDSRMVEPESNSLMQKILAPILKGDWLPEISLADATLAGVGGDELAYTYGAEATGQEAAGQEDAGDDSRPAVGGTELAEAPDESAHEDFASPSLGGDEQSPEERAGSDPHSNGAAGTDVPGDATSSGLGNLGIPAEQPTSGGDGPALYVSQPPAADLGGQLLAYPEPPEEDGPRQQPADGSSFVPGPAEEGSPGGGYPLAEEQQGYDGSSTDEQEPPAFGTAPDAPGSPEDAPADHERGAGDEATGDDLSGLIGEGDSPGNSDDAPGHNDGTAYDGGTGDDEFAAYDDGTTGRSEDPGDSGSALGQGDGVGASPEVIEAVDQYLQTGDPEGVEDAVGDDVEEKTTCEGEAGSPPDCVENNHDSEVAGHENPRSDAEPDGFGGDDQSPPPEPPQGGGPEAPPAGDPAGGVETGGESSSEQPTSENGFGLPRDPSNGRQDGSDGGRTQEPQPKPEDGAGSIGQDSSGAAPGTKGHETSDQQDDRSTDPGATDPEHQTLGTTRETKGGPEGQDIASGKGGGGDRRDAKPSDHDKPSGQNRHGGDPGGDDGSEQSAPERPETAEIPQDGPGGPGRPAPVDNAPAPNQDVQDAPLGVPQGTRQGTPHGTQLSTGEAAQPRDDTSTDPGVVPTADGSPEQRYDDKVTSSRSARPDRRGEHAGTGNGTGPRRGTDRARHDHPAYAGRELDDRPMLDTSAHEWTVASDRDERQAAPAQGAYVEPAYGPALRAESYPAPGRRTDLASAPRRQAHLDPEPTYDPTPVRPRRVYADLAPATAHAPEVRRVIARTAPAPVPQVGAPRAGIAREVRAARNPGVLGGSGVKGGGR